ncbi:AraC family transcriptional regulator [Actinomycetospora sp. NBRC 106375]|uniref:helix-turn-helix transcriptional regulator n=1 Tax=Actinomycetospora sp. NBRC 106375 TaxID=3032207 RepID=UPI0025557165|nr:AraC family transcriptional regulator [Actinomycetospora sp. NBRC 106375]
MPETSRRDQATRPERCLAAGDVPVEEIALLCRRALRVTAAVCWAEIAVPVRAGTTVTATAGDLPDTVVDAMAQGPRTASSRSGHSIMVDDVGADRRWPGLRGGHEGHDAAMSVLTVPVGGGGATLALAAGAARAFDPAARAVATEIARHAYRLLAFRLADPQHGAWETATRAHDAVVAARALLARRDQVSTDVAFDTLLERADQEGTTVGATAEEILAELGPAAEYGPVARAPEPATLRRAVAYLEEHAAEDVDVTDVAEVAGLGVRGLQMAFRRWRGTTPLGHLREIRLARAHEELRSADPRTATVADVAARWHFTHPGRFSVTYRRRYGCSPSDTLRA